MNVSGEYRVTAAREQVWQALHDADTLRLCLPGCEDVRALTPHHYVGRMMARIGTVSTVFNGRMMVSDEHFPKDWQLAGHAESPTAGWADGSASIRLAAVPGGTVVSYRLHLDPGGRLASVGDRLLRGTAMRLANDFFTRLTERLMPEPPADEPLDRRQPAAAPPRRMVEPLAPMPAGIPPQQPPVSAPALTTRGQRVVIGIGLAFCAFILLSMGLALLSRW